MSDPFYSDGQATLLLGDCRDVLRELPAASVQCVVLDPFSGAGTTLKVAKALGRHGIGVELSEDYCAMTVKRLPQMGMAL